MRTLWTVVGLGVLSFAAVACGGSNEDDAEESGDFGALEENESGLRGRTLTIPSGGSKSFTFTTQAAGAVALSVDCGINANPDVVGNVFSVDSPSLNLPANETPKAAYFAWSGEVDAGSHTVTLKSVQGSGRCSIKVGRAPAGSCSAYKAYRSPNTNHTHFAVASNTASDWEAFPASGNHWGAWAPWNKTYASPVKRAFGLHNLEHGGAILSYKCASADESNDCKDARDKLEAFVQDSGLTRYFIAPDPEQPEMFAIRTWRMVYTSSCWSDAAGGAFVRDNIRNGREDIDADPPIPFDPTTTNVPCQNLMAAPDSCY